MYIPTRSSRRYLYLRGASFDSRRLDRSGPTVVPDAATQLVPLPDRLEPAEFDIQQRSANNPDQGTAQDP